MSRVWPLPFATPHGVVDKASAVKLVVFDVDGVLTDGSVTYGPQGEEYKTFNIRDGQGIKSLLDFGIDTAIVSARNSPALVTRAQELGIRHIETNASDKLRASRALMGKCTVREDQCCYVGDDVIDIPAMLECGLGIAVADAHHTVRHIAQWITPSDGGRGAVREVCDVILYAQKKLDIVMDRHMKISTAT
ncbi:MAG: 3-deoxy-D-manno-octulosonate 8-phosphate phosphatase KdsC [Gammaproteobacteria bacterium]|nr:3-deoxy-D-manno-octulosonate 8-phosphate phosphatase KdsC [Gammaproteobacteria bacterium]